MNDRDNTDFYRNLDPDAFYPVHGDGSGTVKDTNSQGWLSFEEPVWTAQWGKYIFGITGNEFASFSRTLYGGKGARRSLFAALPEAPRGKASSRARDPGCGRNPPELR